MWSLSGVLMVLPGYWFGAVTRSNQPAVDYHNITLSPAQAIASLEQHTGTRSDVRNIQLQQIHTYMLYRINAKGQKPVYINSQTGEYFEFTPELAEDVTRTNFEINSPLEETIRLTEHDISYPFGQLPVFRVRFTDQQGVSYIVSERNATVYRSSTLSRIRSAINSMHTFQPLNFLTDNEDVIKWLLVLTGTLSLLGAMIGYILTLPVGRKNKQPAG
jgi:hypothetical protein